MIMRGRLLFILFETMDENQAAALARDRHARLSKPPGRSQAETMARAKHLHRMPLLAARGPDAATIEFICRRLHRQVHGLGDGSSHGFGARSGRTLLGFGDVLKIF